MQPNTLIDSAKGWHNIQLAVLGFIGFCGVLRMGEPATGPEWLGWWSTAMSLLAFATALLSTWMVGSVAFPLYGGGQAEPPADLPPNAGGKLRAGIRMTFAAIIMMVLASLSGWWPGGGAEDAAQVEVTGASGDTACGTWMEGAPAGSMWLRTDEGTVTVSLRQLSEVRPVGSC